MTITNNSPTWPQEPSEGDTFVFTGEVWCGEDFAQRTFISWPVVVSEVVPKSKYGGGFYALLEGVEVFVNIDEYSQRLATVRRATHHHN